MSKTPSTLPLLKHYTRILRSWPTDALRPVSFQQSLRSRLQTRFLAPTAAATPADSVTAATSTSSATNKSKPNRPAPSDARARAEETAANVQGGAGSLEEKIARMEKMAATKEPQQGERDETEQANALYSLLENRYRNTYACSERLLKPQSNEGYYENLAKEMEVAPGRSWWMRKWIRWRGIVRLS